MEEELKKGIANCAVQICKEYEKISALLASVSPSNSVLQQYLKHMTSTLQYAAVHFQDASSLDLATCKLRHDPARLLNEVESRFNMQEQGFYNLYPNAQFKAQIKSCFEATKMDFDTLESCLSAIP